MAIPSVFSSSMIFVFSFNDLPLSFAMYSYFPLPWYSKVHYRTSNHVNDTRDSEYSLQFNIYHSNHVYDDVPKPRTICAQCGDSLSWF